MKKFVFFMKSLTYKVGGVEFCCYNKHMKRSKFKISFNYYLVETLLRNGDMELRAREEEIRILELEVNIVSLILHVYMWSCFTITHA